MDVKRHLTALGIMAVFAFGTYEVAGYSRTAAAFPRFVTVTGVLLAGLWLLIGLGGELRRRTPAKVAHDGTVPPGAAGRPGADAPEGEQDREGAAPEDGSVLRSVAWLAGYGLLMWFVGFFVASAVFLVVYLLLEAKIRWYLVVLVTVAVLGGMYAMGLVLDFRWPDGTWFPR